MFVSATTQWYDFIGSGGPMRGVRVLHPDKSVTTRYFQTDNLHARSGLRHRKEGCGTDREPIIGLR